MIEAILPVEQELTAMPVWLHSFICLLIFIIVFVFIMKGRHAMVRTIYGKEAYERLRKMGWK